MANLVKRPDNKWLVTHVVNKEVVHEKFDNMELAAEFMVSRLGIPDDDIDDALMHMAACNHLRAIFVNNRFARSEET